ncbi:MAG: TonB-dependent receptor [Hyphomonadaceae bacterium JAD_PAG50586_4]|nr:MAG: TonB-dependent receptor [Hyphomonadaceae bacterium JAD_PAG50586_4]
MGKRAILMGAAGAMSLAALASPAWAQDADADANTEIVVTAQKREENLFEVPLAVQALSSEQLENAGVDSVEELTALIPGASVVSSTAPGFGTVQIRGISSGTTGDGLVGYYIDETPFGVPNLQLTPPASMLDIERAEVIRGPSGTLYGQGSMGGTVRLVTRRPDSREFSGRLQVEGSQTEDGGDNYALGAVINIPIAEDRLALRIAGQYEELGGFAAYDDVATLGLDGEDVNESQSANVRATLLWTPTPDLDVSGTYWRIENELVGSNSFSLSYPEPTTAGSGRGPGFTNTEMDLFSLTVNWDLGGSILTSNSSYIDHTLDLDTPFLIALVNDSTFDTTSFTQEVRLTSDNDSAFRWMFGGFYRDATIDSDICVYAVACPVFSVINVVGPLETRSWSVFGEASLELFDGKLVPLVGVRYFEDERSADGLDRATLISTSVAAEWSNLSPRFNLTYNASDTFIMFFNAANGFRSGALQTPSQAAAANTALGLPPGTITEVIDPDELWTYELGTRWQTENRDLMVEASVYHTDWSDVQTQFASSAVISVANAGDYSIDGFDIGVLWRTPIDGLTLNAVANFNDTEIERAPAALSAATAIDPGARIPNVPENNYTIAATYERDVSWFGGSTLTFYSGYAYRNEQLDATTGAASDQTNDLTLRIGLEHGNWELEAFALNALNDDDFASVAPASGIYQILYPRRVGLKLGVNF